MAEIVKPQYAKIVKLYRSLEGKYQLWELWLDSMTMFAVMISNTVDFRYKEQREAMYKASAEKYTSEELDVFAEIFVEITEQIEKNPEQDFLGDLYMTFGLGSHWHGQFFTPYIVSQLLAEIDHLDEITEFEKVKPIKIHDCACGGGALVIAAAHAFRKSIQKTGLNFQDYACIYAQDISQVAGLMAYIQISLQGLAGKIKIADSLINPIRESDDGEDIWYTPMWFSSTWTTRRIIKLMEKL